jgi:hypothetical protein
VFASAAKFLQPGIITLFALKVSLPATEGVADKVFVVRKYKLPTTSAIDADEDAVDTVNVTELLELVVA